MAVAEGYSGVPISALTCRSDLRSQRLSGHIAMPKAGILADTFVMAATGDTPEGPPLDPDDINSRLDEIAAELATEARFKEPSAAERAEAAAARRASQARRPSHAALPPGGPLRRRRHRRRTADLHGPGPDRGYSMARSRPARLRPLVAVATVIAALFALSVGLHVLLHRASQGPAPPPTATPTLSPLFTAADPFANSLAAGYADGQAGIVLPAAGPVGHYTAAQVASAYRSVRLFLAAADLNWPTLAGDSPTAFAALLIPGQRAWFDAGLDRTGVTKQGLARSTRVWVTSFYPGSADFVGTVIKVHGDPMTASVIEYAGMKVLRIVANYLFVYAVQQPGAPADRARVTTHVQMTVYFARWTDRSGPLQPWVASVSASHAGALCGQTDGFVHPQFSRPGAVTPAGPADPYDLGTPITSGACQASTGT
jgi:hypothetical protein